MLYACAGISMCTCIYAHAKLSNFRKGLNPQNPFWLRQWKAMPVNAQFLDTLYHRLHAQA